MNPGAAGAAAAKFTGPPVGPPGGSGIKLELGGLRVRCIDARRGRRPPLRPIPSSMTASLPAAA